ncbi:MAG TPA: hypothetical protein VFL57_16335 [Bryobacteraceae bacterium]|nr:hypothetical protein [Bryobacteraceae bacterium]
MWRLRPGLAMDRPRAQEDPKPASEGMLALAAYVMAFVAPAGLYNFRFLSGRAQAYYLTLVIAAVASALVGIRLRFGKPSRISLLLATCFCGVLAVNQIAGIAADCILCLTPI